MRFEPDVLAALDAWAAARRWNRTTAISYLAEQGIGWPAEQLANPPAGRQAAGDGSRPETGTPAGQ